MSTTVVTYPIIGALATTEQFLGPHRVWQANNLMQREFLAQFFTDGYPELPLIKEIVSKASYSAEELNKFLAEHNFSIKLDPFRAHEFGAVSILDVLVQWLTEGTPVKILSATAKQEHDGFILKGKDDGVGFYRSLNHGNVVAQLQTKGKDDGTPGDSVFITIAPENPPEAFSLVTYVREIAQSLSPCYDFSEIHIPKVDLDQEVDIKWLVGMRTLDESNELWEISQALQQTKFRMNEKGARAKSAVAVAVMKLSAMQGLPKPPLIINKPFLFWIQREGLSKPFFTGYITEEHWKDGGSLDSL